jgi:ferredoxin
MLYYLDVLLSFNWFENSVLLISVIPYAPISLLCKSYTEELLKMYYSCKLYIICWSCHVELSEFTEEPPILFVKGLYA